VDGLHQGSLVAGLFWRDLPRGFLGLSIDPILTKFEDMDSDSTSPHGFYEFFAGGGMARLGLAAGWQCLFANDVDPKKAESYRANFHGAPEFVLADVATVKPCDLPGKAKLAWASFPCQDLSLAGAGAGLEGSRSGMFWAFWGLIRSLQSERRAPPIIALENVAGLITSNGGKDLTAVVGALVEAGYRVGAMLIDGAYFVPQSRPRLYIVGFAKGTAIPKELRGRVPNPAWHPKTLQDVVASFPPALAKAWQWWRLPAPVKEAPHLADIIEADPQGVSWHSASETKRLLSMMTSANRLKVEESQESGAPCVGTVYKRTRLGVQRAEIRFDGVSGCLRTPAGGSSRQIIMIVEGPNVRSRLISPRETARLMGLPDSYNLPSKYNDAYHLTGDGLVVPAVAWLRRHLLEPLAKVVSPKALKGISRA
jgi:DNA (cytosine-5)-methyltransferase 1